MSKCWLRTPSPQPYHPGLRRARSEKVSLPKPAWAESNFSVTRRCCIIIREFFTTAIEGSSTQEPPSLPRQIQHNTTHDSHRGCKGMAAGHNERASTRSTHSTVARSHSECASTNGQYWPSLRPTLAVRAYHGTPDWWDLHPPLPPPFQLPGVAPPVLASRSIPPNPTTQGLRRARCEKISLLKQKVPSR